MSKKLIIISSIALLIMAGLACEKILPKMPSNDEILDGPVEGLTPEQNNIFLRGDVAFNDEIFTPETGLGPLFVATSCGTCHAGGEAQQIKMNYQQLAPEEKNRLIKL